MRQVYILSAEYSAPVTSSKPERVFADTTRTAESTDEGGEPLFALMSRASRRALNATGIENAAAKIDHLMLTTMPIADPDDPTHFVMPRGTTNLGGRLKGELKLGENCRERFELGTSDAGASLLASAVHLLRGLAGSATALVVAGQVMPVGAAAIETVAQVLEEDEKRFGLRMIPIGDLLLDALWFTIQAGGHKELRFTWGTSDGSGEDASHRESFTVARDPTGLATQLTLHKLRLAKEYSAAQRNDETDPDSTSSSPMAWWLTKWHLAAASNGACAVVLTTNDDLVREWLQAKKYGRVVRVIGIGEGDDNPLVSQRREPFLFLKSVRQALAQLRRETETDLDFLQRSAFAVLHDAFPSIEMSFLIALGFSPIEAVHRSMSHWPNPYGGLTGFGHALAASGLVQIAKAFHIFVRPDEYVPQELPETLHRDYTRTPRPIHCLTSSVGGPLTHIVTMLLESVPVGERAELPPSYAPRRRHGPMPEVLLASAELGPMSFERKRRWAQEQMELYRRACHQCELRRPDASIGVVEARTRLDLRSIEVPLPRHFFDRWKPAHPGADTHVLPETPPEIVAILTKPDFNARDGSLDNAVSDIVRNSGTALSSRETWEQLRPHVALISGGGPHLNDHPHRICLLPDPNIQVGALVRVGSDGVRGFPFIIGVVADAPGLVPLWYQHEAGEERPLLKNESGISGLVEALREGRMSIELWQQVFARAEDVLHKIRSNPQASPPPSAVRLVKELLLTSAPNRWHVADALERLSGADVGEARGTSELTGCALFSLAQPTNKPQEINAVLDAISQFRGWLAGADIRANPFAESVSVFARFRRPSTGRAVEDGEAWPLILRFAKDVYARCLDQGVRLRIAVNLARDGTSLIQRGEYLGMAGGGQSFARDLLEERLSRRAEEGIAIVIHRSPSGDASAKALLARSERYWSQAGGESLSVGSHGFEEHDSGCYFFQVRRREDAARSSVQQQASRKLDHPSYFVSYTRNDRAFVKRLLNVLNAAGTDHWYAPQHARQGVKIKQQIRDEIMRRDRVLVVCSQSSLRRSKWVRWEIELALEKERRTRSTVLFPIVIDEALFGWKSRLAAKVREILAADFRGATKGPKFEQQVSKLIENLQ